MTKRYPLRVVKTIFCLVLSVVFVRYFLKNIVSVRCLVLGRCAFLFLTFLDFLCHTCD